MYKAFCDNVDCNKPIEPADNHIEIAQIGVIDKKQIFRAQALHFCGKGCINKWLDKATNRPLLVESNGAALPTFPHG